MDEVGEKIAKNPRKPADRIEDYDTCESLPPSQTAAAHLAVQTTKLSMKPAQMTQHAPCQLLSGVVHTSKPNSSEQCALSR